MFLSHLYLQNFRSYTKAEFTFDKRTTLIVGPNTSGKTNLIEAISFLSTGKSFRTEKDIQAVQFGKSIARVKGQVNDTEPEVVIICENNDAGTRQAKKYLVNGVSKRRVDFADNLASVLFSPLDLQIIVGSPGLRRAFLDTVLEQANHEYRLAAVQYSKALRQRNALLERVKETGKWDEKHFSYWDEILIEQGKVITDKREAFIAFLNKEKKEIFDFAALYDKSTISKERLLQYKDAEAGAGVTLVGPHRDDFTLSMFDNRLQSTHDVRFFGSRGQQRLAILQLKMLQMSFIERVRLERPLLLLDDIFSELDEDHIALVMEILPLQQAIMTTTHKEFVDKKSLKNLFVIELK